MSYQGGEEIYVKTPMFEGSAIVTGFLKGELFPVEVTLDECDDDGHKYKRVSLTEVVPLHVHSADKNVVVNESAVQPINIEEQQLIFDL